MSIPGIATLCYWSLAGSNKEMGKRALPDTELSLSPYERQQKRTGKARHEGVKRLVSAANDCRDLGQRCFPICREVQLVDKGLRHMS